MSRGNASHALAREAGPRSLKRNFGSALVGNLAYTVSQFGMLVALARLTDVRQVGQYALALAIAGPIFVFLGLKLRQVQVTDVLGQHEPGDFVALRLITSMAGLLVTAAVALVYPAGADGRAVLLAVAAFKAVEAQIDVYYGALQRREQMHLIANSQIIRAVGGLVVFTGTLAAWRSVTWAVLATTVFTLVPMLVTMAQVRSLGVPTAPRFDLRALRGLAVLALPLGVSVSVGAFIVSAPRLQIEAISGAAQLGVFAVLSYSLVATSTVAGSLAEAASPRLSNLAAAKDRRAFLATLKRLSLVGAGLGLAGMVAAALVGRLFLELLFGAEYGDEWLVLVALMGAATVQYGTLFLGTAVNALRLFTVQMPISVVGLMAVVAAGAMAIPAWGLMGAAAAIGVSQLAMAAMYAVLLQRRVLPALQQR